jgi:hypothetical protein
LVSGKWSKDDVADFGGQLGLEISGWWKYPEIEYSKPMTVPKQVYNADSCSTFCFIFISGSYWLEPQFKDSPEESRL